MRSRKRVAAPLASLFIFLFVVLNRGARWTSLRMATLIKKKMLLWKEVRRKECRDNHCSYCYVLFKLKSRALSSSPSQWETCLFFSSLSLRWKFLYALHPTLRALYLPFPSSSCLSARRRVVFSFFLFSIIQTEDPVVILIIGKTKQFSSLYERYKTLFIFYRSSLKY